MASRKHKKLPSIIDDKVKRNKTLKLILILILMFCFGIKPFSQTNIIEIDTISNAASNVMPYNKSFTIKVAIEADEVSKIFFIKKYKYFDLENSISHYISNNNNSLVIPEIPSNYYNVRKIGDKNYLFLTFSDNYMLEPSASYFIIIAQKKLGTSVLGFFDNYYLSQTSSSTVDSAKAFKAALESIREFEKSMKKIFGKPRFGYLTENDFLNNQNTFLSDFNKYVLTEYNSYSSAVKSYPTNITNNSIAMAAITPNLDSLTFNQLFVDSTINKEAIAYILGKDLSFNNIASDINTVTLQTRIEGILNGSVALNCIFCNSVNVNSTLSNDINKRITNIDSTINLLNNVKRALFLLKPKFFGSSNITTTINNLVNWINYLQISKKELNGLLKLRKVIESKILENYYAGTSFNISSIASGNSYLNFDTRNKVLLTPDFGIVTSAITKKGKSLDYGIVPYLGFHVNFMAVDKDLPFNSYKKNWKQYFSLMIGWSLVNQQQDSTYSNFFEKSTILTGLGIRVNNVIRITAGSQWLFKLGSDANNNKSRKLFGVPFIGVSFDLNVKQYLNGFVDLLSGIGKTKSPNQTSMIN